ncbi:MAG: DUF1294 domain-containing protein [Paludibacteraceae bacterium]|nr:DUF1294 domain-containing protein [Paludibacteraceae bacterium]MBO7258452.1 DUF1294 domain-containing protein [Paludibacteraceae bacterium]
MLLKVAIIYLFIVNLIGSSLLMIDKHKAIKSKWRIPEKRLHLFELAGGIFSMLPLSYFIHHKNRKNSYRIISWLIALAWTALIILIVYHS